MRCQRTGQTVESKRAARRALRRFGLSFVLLVPLAFCVSPSSAHARGWTRQETGSLAWLRAVYFIDAETGWAVGGGGALIKTTDGGQRWQQLRRPTEDILRDVYFTDPATGWLVCERSIYLLKTNDEPRSYLLKTIDGGATWKRIQAAGTDVDARLVRLIFAGESRAWVFGEMGALYTTTDGGATWARQRTPTRNLLLGGSFLDAQQGWLVGAGATIIETSDGGTTWRNGQIQKALLSTASNSAAAAPVAAVATASQRGLVHRCPSRLGGRGTRRDSGDERRRADMASTTLRHRRRSLRREILRRP